MQGTPKFLIVRPVEDNDKISAEERKMFWSGVGMLLYLIQHSRFNIVNMIQELSNIASMIQKLSNINDGVKPLCFVSCYV